MTLDDGTSITYTVKNGEKGDKGDNVYTWVKYASQEPTEESHSMGDIPDDWRGEYNGPLAEAPTDWKQYKWYKIKGEQGNTGSPATIENQSVTYQASDSGTIIPSGTWGTSVPVVAQGKYLWTRSTIAYNTGSPVVSYSVSRMGIDGSGAVSSVCGVSPDSNGNVALAAGDVGAMPTTGGDFTGPVKMNGQTLSGLNAPAADDEAATKAYADKMLQKSGGIMYGVIDMGNNRITSLSAPVDNADASTKNYVDTAVADAKTYVDSKRITKTETITTDWSGSDAPYTQSVTVSGILASDMPHIAPVYSTTNATAIAQKEAWACVSKAETSDGTITFTCFEEKPTIAIPIQIEVIR